MRELARWNGISDTSVLSVGQTLRLTPPAGVATVTPVTPTGSTEVRPLPAPGAVEAPPPVARRNGAACSGNSHETGARETGAGETGTGEAGARGKRGAVAVAGAGQGHRDVSMRRTTRASISPAMTAIRCLPPADGEVVYVGSALRGYGNLVIVKHNDEFISAYAHNRQILVKQGQAVKRGQRIAEFGRSDADRTKLHFEIRRQGKPVDPLRYLPAR